MGQRIHALNVDAAVDYHYGKFPPEALDAGALLKPLTNAASAIARFDQVLQTLHDSEILLGPVRNQEAVISSRMEGTVSTVDEVLRYEADVASGETGAEPVRTEIIETFLYQHALRIGQGALEDGVPISDWLVRRLHEALLSIGRGARHNPGRYKTEQNYLADGTKKNILFVPIIPEKLRDGLDALFSYLNDGDDQALLKTALSHVEFEALHPFDDGNGRVGRMLITLLLWREKQISAPHFYVSGYLEEHKEEYVDRMRRVSSHGDWLGWSIFFLGALEAQAYRNLAMAEQIQTLYETSKARFSDALSSKWSIQMLDFVFANPFFRTSKLIADTDISGPTARRFVRSLQNEGSLVCLEEAAGRRPALYAFEPLLEIVRV
ncbi:MAG: Fic/DOC family N-terminal domain-containing protein [Pseudomonadota bacterium]